MNGSLFNNNFIPFIWSAGRKEKQGAYEKKNKRKPDIHNAINKYQALNKKLKFEF